MSELGWLLAFIALLPLALRVFEMLKGNKLRLFPVYAAPQVAQLRRAGGARAALSGTMA